MAVQSHAFGRVVLTGEDADKFRDQVRYGKPKAAARASVVNGSKLARALVDEGKITFKIKRSTGSK